MKGAWQSCTKHCSLFQPAQPENKALALGSSATAQGNSFGFFHPSNPTKRLTRTCQDWKCQVNQENEVKSRTQRVFPEVESRGAGAGIPVSLGTDSVPALYGSVLAEERISEKSRISVQLCTCLNSTGLEGEKTAIDFTPLPFNEFWRVSFYQRNNECPLQTVGENVLFGSNWKYVLQPLTNSFPNSFLL